MLPSYSGMNGITFYCESYASKGEGSQEKPDCLQKKLYREQQKFPNFLARARETYILMDVPLFCLFPLLFLNHAINAAFFQTSHEAAIARYTRGRVAVAL